MTMKLNAQQMSLSGINEKALAGFSVPDFQRNYSWTDVEIRQFWQDLEAVLEGQSTDHFMGPIVVLESATGRTPLIDGQQRITTLTILASVVRDYLMIEMENPTIEIAGASFFISQNFLKILFVNDMITPRLQSNYQIGRIFEDYIVRNPNMPERKSFDSRPTMLAKKEQRLSKTLDSAQTLLKVLSKNWIERHSASEDRKQAIQKLYEVVSNKIQFLYIEVGSEEDAFTIFETLNDRGLKLSASDLIKSFLLRRIIEQNPATDRVDIIESWEKIPAYLENYDISSFLRHYLLTQEQVPVQKKKIFTLLKADVEEESRHQPQSAKKKLEELINSAFHYGRLLGTESISEDSPEIQRRLGLLEMVGDSYRVFLLRVLQLGYTDDDFLLAIKSVEKIAFRWAICGENAQQLETKFQNAAHELLPGNVENLRQVCNKLIMESPTDDAFSAAFTTRSSRDTRMQAYVMRSLCYGITGSDVTTSRYEVSVEHIAPQNPLPESATEWHQRVAPTETVGDGLTYDDYVYRWGNITILEKKLNSSVGQNVWNIKREGKPGFETIAKFKGYRASNIEVTKHLLATESWTAEQIDRRSEWIASQALIYWKRELPKAGPNQITAFPG
jgi:uncharacterized protein with ParB-like and HNH nuclease domain